MADENVGQIRRFALHFHRQIVGQKETIRGGGWSLRSCRRRLFVPVGVGKPTLQEASALRESPALRELLAVPVVLAAPMAPVVPVASMALAAPTCPYQRQPSCLGTSSRGG